MALSHLELFVNNLKQMEHFYKNVLGFVVTDRGEGEDGMVFLSKNPQEHHQIVLNPRDEKAIIESPIDHISFRIDSLQYLKEFHDSLQKNSTEMQTVSHGNSWSIYFRDPENNRIELFFDTPWHVNQPCKFQIDLSLPVNDLLEMTRDNISNLPGFVEIDKWKEAHQYVISE